MKRELFGAVVALIAVCTLGFSSKQDTLVDTSAYVSTTPNSLPADQEPQAAAAELAASPAVGVSYENRVVTEMVGQWVCDGGQCRWVQVPRQVMRRVAVATRTAVKQVATQAICPCGCPGCDPELCTCLQATLSPPVASVPTPIVAQRVSYTTYPVMTTASRARMPVLFPRLRARLCARWCR